jgi:hypothetical protein
MVPAMGYLHLRAANQWQIAVIAMKESVIWIKQID